MLYRIIALFISTLLVTGAASALERRYLASMEHSSWTLSQSSSTVCRIEHQIPRFGKAVFSQEAGRGLNLELQTRHKIKAGINVELRTETTSWNEHTTRVVLSRFETSGRKKLFKIPSAIAEQTFDELNQGFQPGFLFYDDYPFIASISSVRFGSIMDKFSDCVAGLYADNFKDVQVSNIWFDPDEEFPSIEQEEKAFERMFAYLEIDNSISDILITGHTDKTGSACYNEGLSERRAWYVHDLLVSQGLDPQMLRVDYSGEYKPRKKGNQKKSHAANRRVTVELRR